MTNPDPSTHEDNALDFLAESLDPEDRSLPEPSRLDPGSARDEDRLYTDEFIRQDEQSSRVLFISFIGATAICIGVGLWYFFVRSQTPQTSAPLPVPEQPSLMSPNFSPGQTVPTVPLPSQSLPPTDSGVMSGEKPLSNPSATPKNAAPQSSSNSPLTSPSLVPPPPPSP